MSLRIFISKIRDTLSLGKCGLGKKQLYLGICFLGMSCFFAFRAYSYPLPSQENPIIFYSSDTKSNLKKVILKFLSQAKSSIAAGSYGFSDLEVLSLLKRKDHLPITLFHDKRHHWENKQFLPFSGNVFENTSSGLMHRKFLIIDDAFLCLSSANLTEPSLLIHNNLICLLYHPELASHIKNSFPFSDPRIQYFPLPRCGKEAVTAIKYLIQEATTTVDVALFTFTHKDLIQALLDAKKRGVRVSVTLDKINSKWVSRNAVNALMQAQIDVRQNLGNQLFHHKCALIDEKIVIFGSANWTASAFTKNDEDLFIIKLETEKNKKFFKQFFRDVHQQSSPLS